MHKTNFLLILLVLIILNGVLLCYGFSLDIDQFFSDFYLSQLGFLVIGYGIIGLGFGLPMIFLAFLFGWLQVLLLITGQIKPHLKNAGFLDSLQLLLNKEHLKLLFNRMLSRMLA